MATFLNLAGFGMVAWDRRSVRTQDPFTYRATTLPAGSSATWPASWLRRA